MINLVPDFIVIDDDHINNSVCEKLVGFTFPGASVTSFTDADLALKHLADVSAPTLLLLDIDMPDPTGWEVLEQFAQLPAPVKDKVKILMLSSSVNPSDIDRARAADMVGGYILKPLSVAKLQTIINSLDQPYIDLSHSW